MVKLSEAWLIVVTEIVIDLETLARLFWCRLLSALRSRAACIRSAYIYLGGWNIADCVQRAYDVEKMQVGTIAAGRIGLGVLRRLHPFDCVLHYTDRHRLPEEVEKELNLTYHAKVIRICFM